MNNLFRRFLGRWKVLLLDMVLIPCAWFSAYWMSFNLSTIPTDVLHHAWVLLPRVMLIQAIAYFTFGIHNSVWRFTSHHDFIRIIESTLMGTVGILFTLLLTHHLHDVTRAVLPMYTMLLTAFLCGVRTIYRLVYEKQMSREIKDCSRVLIIGAGQAGEHLLRDIQQDVHSQYVPVAFVDDMTKKQWRSIRGIKVVGQVSDIPEVVIQYDIELIFIAIPSAGSSLMRQIVALCEGTGLPFRTLPSLQDLAKQQIGKDALREVQLEDILGRDPVELDYQKIQKEIGGMRVLISGGGGSIGRELTLQIAKLAPAEIIVIENNEYNLYKLDYEINKRFPHINVTVYLCDVKNEIRVADIFNRHRPEIVFHAAAYKHVPMLEHQIVPAMMNNLIGTKVMAEQSATYGVDTFVLISTDKAVNPTNIMGASKRAAEVFCQNYGKEVDTRFITVRFGNVLGSAGSVIPLFKEQIAAGGPLTVTDPEVTRYFMTIPEACLLILQAKTIGQGGEIFVLEMGEPVKIGYLAEQMIRLSGLTPYKDIDIQYIGLRPGEKLHEELFHTKEQLMPTGHAKILTARSRDWDFAKLTALIKRVEQAGANLDQEALADCLKEIVPEWQSESRQQNLDLPHKSIQTGRSSKYVLQGEH